MRRNWNGTGKNRQKHPPVLENTAFQVPNLPSNGCWATSYINTSVFIVSQTMIRAKKKFQQSNMHDVYLELGELTPIAVSFLLSAVKNLRQHESTLLICLSSSRTKTWYVALFLELIPILHLIIQCDNFKQKSTEVTQNFCGRGLRFQKVKKVFSYFQVPHPWCHHQ